MGEPLWLPPGWSYRPDDPALIDRWGEPAVAGHGRHQRIANVVHGVDRGRPFCAFTVPFPGGRGIRVVAAADAGRSLPTLSVEQRSFSRLGRTLLLGRARQLEIGPRKPLDRLIGLETGDEAFDREFVVHCEDGAAAALSVLTPRVRAAIVSRHDLPVACQGRDVLSWSSGEFGLDHVRRLLDLAVFVASGAGLP